MSVYCAEERCALRLRLLKAGSCFNEEFAHFQRAIMCGYVKSCQCVVIVEVNIGFACDQQPSQNGVVVKGCTVKTVILLIEFDVRGRLGIGVGNGRSSVMNIVGVLCQVNVYVCVCVCVASE